MIHIPFAKAPIMDALPRFTINGDKPNGGTHGFYDADAHRSWGLLYATSPEKNYLKS